MENYGMSDDRGARLAAGAIRRRLTRRGLFHKGVAAVVGSSLLGACLGRRAADDHDDTATSGNGNPQTGSPEIGTGNVINAASSLADSGIGNPILTGAIDWLQFYVFNRLMTFNENGVLEPELAESWEYSPDQRTLTLHLAEATWHDGEAFTADDVIFTFDSIRNAKTDTPLRPGLQVNGEFVSWEKVDERTVRITTPIPFAPLIYHLNEIGIIPSHLLAEVRDANVASFNTNPIGTGAYRVAEWQPGTYVRLESYADHFRGRPINDGLVVYFHPDAAARSAALGAGKIDLMFAPPADLQRYDDNPDVTLHRYVYFTPVTLAFNFRHPLLADIAVRQAFALAIDKATLSEAVTGGRGIVAHNQFAVTGPLDRYNDYQHVRPTAFDPESAARLLDENGYIVAHDGVRVAPSGQRLSFNMVTYSGIAEYVTAKDMLKSMLAEVGIEIKPKVVDYPTLRQMWNSPSDDPNVRALELEEWPHPFDFDPDVYDELDSQSVAPDGRNYMFFHDNEVDRLVEAGRTETDPDQRVEVYHRLDQRRSQVLPSLPLYCSVDGWVVSNRVKGVKRSTYFRRYRLIGLTQWWKDV
jgi:peptide/nickel transport system substrate-binding protein